MLGKPPWLNSSSRSVLALGGMKEGILCGVQRMYKRRGYDVIIGDWTLRKGRRRYKGRWILVEVQDEKEGWVGKMWRSKRGEQWKRRKWRSGKKKRRRRVIVVFFKRLESGAHG